jgi:plasmid stability protein
MANFILRNADDKLWAKFKARAAKEGHPMRWLILEMIRRYVEHGL